MLIFLINLINYLFFFRFINIFYKNYLRLEVVKKYFVYNFLCLQYKINNLFIIYFMSWNLLKAIFSVNKLILNDLQYLKVNYLRYYFNFNNTWRIKPRRISFLMKILLSIRILRNNYIYFGGCKLTQRKISKNIFKYMKLKRGLLFYNKLNIFLLNRLFNFSKTYYFFLKNNLVFRKNVGKFNIYKLPITKYYLYYFWVIHLINLKFIQINLKSEKIRDISIYLKDIQKFIEIDYFSLSFSNLGFIKQQFLVFLFCGYYFYWEYLSSFNWKYLY